MIFLNKTRAALIPLLFVSSLASRNIVLELKAAYFQPTNNTFLAIYNHGNGLYGPELTVQLCEEKNWYAFASFDYFKKNGVSVGLGDPTTVKLIPLALGIKYFIPTKLKPIDLYVGLGFEPINVRTTDYSDGIVSKQSQWGFGGIAKIGAYYYLPHNFVLDFFIDYSFAKVSSNNNDFQNLAGAESTKANVSGAIFGVGLGYNFN